MNGKLHSVIIVEDPECIICQVYAMAEIESKRGSHMKGYNLKHCVYVPCCAWKNCSTPMSYPSCTAKCQLQLILRNIASYLSYWTNV